MSELNWDLLVLYLCHHGVQSLAKPCIQTVPTCQPALACVGAGTPIDASWAALRRDGSTDNGHAICTSLKQPVFLGEASQRSPVHINQTALMHNTEA